MAQIDGSTSPSSVSSFSAPTAPLGTGSFGAPGRPAPLAGGLMGVVVRLRFLVLALLCVALYLPGWFTLPPLDRDESRFAQASKQMLETRDFIAIYYHDGFRNKKPAGIHWLQSASTAVFGTDEHNQIWTYRLPSVIGAILAVWLVCWVGTLLFDRETGFLAGAVIAGSLSLVGETNISKTDAVLLATVVGAQGLLARAYFANKRDDIRFGLASAMGLWAVLAAGVLIKGPIQPMVILFTGLVLVALDKDRSWLKTLRPLRGFALLSVLVLPWVISVTFATEGTFMKEAVGTDLLMKVFRAMEQHGGPPGFYLSLSPATFFPGTIFLIPAVIYGVLERKRPEIRFLIAWLVPSWIFFEIVATKLPHYTLPTYPALALLIAAMILATAREQLAGITGRASKLAFGWAGKVSLLLFVLVGLVGAGAISALPFFYGNGPTWYLFIVSGLMGFAVLATATIALQKDGVRATVAAVATGVILVAGLLELTAPKLEKLDVSRNVAAMVATVKAATGEPNATVGTAGYREPSLVFLLGTETRLDRPASLVALLQNTPGAIGLVESRDRPEFDRLATERGLAVREMGSVSGINYSRDGKDVTIFAFVADPSRSPN